MRKDPNLMPPNCLYSASQGVTTRSGGRDPDLTVGRDKQSSVSDSIELLLVSSGVVEIALRKLDVFDDELSLRWARVATPGV
jgi:hypothetical protein